MTLQLIAEIIAYALTIGLICGFALFASWLLWMRESAEDIIEREMSKAPPEPVHDDIRDMVVQRYDFGLDRPPLDSEMEMVRDVIARVSE